jgi:hypothetical protein
MQTQDFSMEEIEVMRDMLEHQLEEMEVELGRTDTHDFKQMLKHRRDLMHSVLEKLSGKLSHV